MPKKNIFNHIHATIEEGRSNNLGLNAKLVLYKKKERELSAKYSHGKDVGKAFVKDAHEVGERWLEIIVDIACKEGSVLDKEFIEDLRETYRSAVQDLVNPVGEYE